MNPLLERIDVLAADVGRLRRRVDPDSSLVHLAGRLAANVESLDCMLQRSAGELYRDFLAECGDEQAALDEALAAVDTRARSLRALLGEAA